MKKKMIAAGAASLALAAMPVVGVFAVGHNGTLTDTIQANIAESCTFTRDETVTDPSTTPATTDLGHTSGTWTRNQNDSTIDILTAVTIPTGSEQTLGNSKFTVACNDTDGYQVALTTHGNLKIGGNTDPINTWAYAAAAPSGTISSSYWRIDVSGAEGTDLSQDIVSTKSAVQNKIDFTVTYKAYAINEQDAGTYAANAVYTFTQL